MTNLQIREFPDDLAEALKQQAKSRGESLQRHLTSLLENEARRALAAEIMDETAKDLKGVGDPPYTSSADLIQELRREREDELFNG